MSVVDFANEVLDMHEEIRHLRMEVKRLRYYEHEYHKLLNESVAHGEQMIVGLIGIAMKRPDLLPALEPNP